MPSVSKAQQRLMAAAEHGATFPMAAKLRQSMTHDQLHDFAATKTKSLPAHVPAARPKLSSVGQPQAAPAPRRNNLGGYQHPKKVR